MRHKKAACPECYTEQTEHSTGRVAVHRQPDNRRRNCPGSGMTPVAVYDASDCPVCTGR